MEGGGRETTSGNSIRKLLSAPGGTLSPSASPVTGMERGAGGGLPALWPHREPLDGQPCPLTAVWVAVWLAKTYPVLAENHLHPGGKRSGLTCDRAVRVKFNADAQNPNSTAQRGPGSGAGSSRGGGTG